MGSKVIKHGIVKRRKGVIFKKYKDYELYLLQNGMLLFFTLDTKSKNYGGESKGMRMQLDETLRVESQNFKEKNIRSASRNSIVQANDDHIERFIIRLSGSAHYFECKKSHDWLNSFKNFDFR